MSSNLSVINFTVGGTLVVTGSVSLGESLKSSSSAQFQSLSTVNLPTCNEVPTVNNQLTNKLFIDNEIKTINARFLKLEKYIQKIEMEKENI
jgi:hypothetical protein